MNISAVLDLLRPEISSLNAYDNLRGVTATDAIILDSNENIVSPTKQLTNEERYRYPLIRPESLIQRLAAIYQVETEQVLLGRGSDDIIDLLIRAFCAAGEDAILQANPCFAMYSVSAKIQGAEVKSVPLHECGNYQYRIDDLIAALEEKVKLVFLASPQSPTGNLLNQSDLEKLLHAAKSQLIVIDEAYIEFSEARSASKLLGQYPNLLVMRTLSKAYGLANLRCGALLAHAKLIKKLRPVLTPYALPGIVVQAAYEALANENLAKLRAYNRTMPERKRVLVNALKKFGWVSKIYSSETNFILCRVADAENLNHYLRSKNIFVRSYMQGSELADCIRISIGSQQEITRLLDALDIYSEQV